MNEQIFGGVSLTRPISRITSTPTLTTSSESKQADKIRVDAVIKELGEKMQTRTDPDHHQIPDERIVIFENKDAVNCNVYNMCGVMMSVSVDDE